MARKKEPLPCVVCNPEDANPGEYCETHSEQLHRLDHQYENLFRLQRISRGKDHEAYEVFLPGSCDPCGRVIVHETDPELLAVTVLVSGDLNLETPIEEYVALGIPQTYGDQLRNRIEDVVHSWYGNSRACIDIYRTPANQPLHWDIAPRSEQDDQEPGESRSQGGKHSVH
jgi:hypothetical protein